jgi:hypothetical protein
MSKSNNTTTTNTTIKVEEIKGDIMDKSTTKKRSAFSNVVRNENTDNGGFDIGAAADIGLRALVTATCGVLLYKNLLSDDTPAAGK